MIMLKWRHRPKEYMWHASAGRFWLGVEKKVFRGFSYEVWINVPKNRATGWLSMHSAGKRTLNDAKEGAETWLADWLAKHLIKVSPMIEDEK